MLKAGHYTDLLRQVNELKRQLHLVGKVEKRKTFRPIHSFEVLTTFCGLLLLGGP
jgi:hypothetical protein